MRIRIVEDFTRFDGAAVVPPLDIAFTRAIAKCRASLVNIMIRFLRATPFLLVCGACLAANTPIVVDYESGALDSGIPGLAATNAPAADAAYMVSPGAHGSQWAIAHKVMLSDAAPGGGYYSNGSPRSESSTDLLKTTAGTYYNRTEATYTFSLSLRDWQSNAGSPDEDIIWQFKHNGGRHDIALGVQRDKLWLHWDGNTNRQALVANVLAPGSSLSNEWIDFRFHVYWADDATGWFTMDMRLPGETDYGHTVTKTGFSTFDPTPTVGKWGYLKWGMYRNDGNLANGDPDTRIVYHDDITATPLFFKDGFEKFVW
jgi:hypothetical protein